MIRTLAYKRTNEVGTYRLYSRIYLVHRYHGKITKLGHECGSYDYQKTNKLTQLPPFLEVAVDLTKSTLEHGNYGQTNK